MRSLGSAAALLALLHLSAASSLPTVSLLSYGGRGDGVFDNQAAFQSAVAYLATQGGGTLLVPAGAFLTRAFNLTSSMTLFLDAGATIRASVDFARWPLTGTLPAYPSDGPRYSPLIGAYGLRDVKVLGNASAPALPVIDGQGLAWDLASAAKLLRAQRPHALELAGVVGLEVAQVAFVQPAFWTVHLSQCSGAWVHDASFFSTVGNGDGLDVGAQDVLLERLVMTVSDDAIVLKSGDAPAGSGLPPTRNVTIRDCHLASAEGCIAIGSEMTAGVADVVASNITCAAAGHALLYIKERRLAGGYVSNVTLRDSAVTGPVERLLWLSQHFGEGGEHAARGAPAALPVLANVTLQRIAVRDGGVIVQAGLLNGAAAPPGGSGGAGAILGLVLEDLQLGAPLQGWSCANVSGTWRNVSPAPVCAGVVPA